MKPTDLQLKTTLFKILPDENGIEWDESQLLHLCHMAEETLDEVQKEDYAYFWLAEDDLWKMVHSSWQERVIALAKTKGIELK